MCFCLVVREVPKPRLPRIKHHGPKTEASSDSSHFEIDSTHPLLSKQKYSPPNPIVRFRKQWKLQNGTRIPTFRAFLPSTKYVVWKGTRIGPHDATLEGKSSTDIICQEIHRAYYHDFHEMKTRKRRDNGGELTLAAFAAWEEATVSCHWDQLSQPPKKGTRYLDSKGRRLFDHTYDFRPQRTAYKQHPKLVAAKKAGNLTSQLVRFYERVPPHIHVTLAGTPDLRAKPSKLKRKPRLEEDPRPVPDSVVEVCRAHPSGGTRG